MKASTTLPQLLFVLLAAIVVSCGGKQENSQDTDSSSSEPAQPATPELTKETVIAEVTKHPSVSKAFVDKLKISISSGFVEIRYNGVTIARETEGDNAASVFSALGGVRNKVNTVARIIGGMDGVKDVNIINEANE